MKLYHYVPKDSDVLTKGIYSVAKMPEELLKYGKRLGTDDPKKILSWMEGTFHGRSRAISVLTEPVYWQGNDPMLKEWVDKKDLVEIDVDALLADGKIESIWCKKASDADGKNEEINQIKADEIDFSPLPWHLCSKEKGLFFGVIRHYLLVIKEGYIPAKYIRKISPRMSLNIQIQTPTLEQAYSLFLQNISRIDWYEENGRFYFLKSLQQMEKPLINQMIDERELLKTNKSKYTEKFQHPFEKELYHPERYERLANEILSYKDTFDKIYNKFKAMHDSWGFIILSEYTIDLNMYVGNGSYNAKTGHILLGIKGGGIQVNMSTIKLIMHEMIHLGIENLIIKDKSGKLLLQQEEKERVVDNLCQYVGKGIFDEKLLQFQSITEPYSYMDKLCTGQPQKDLVKEIQRFLKENK